MDLLLSVWKDYSIITGAASNFVHTVEVDGVPNASSKGTYLLSPMLCVLAGPGSDIVWPQPVALFGTSARYAGRTPKVCSLSQPDPHLGDAGAPSSDDGIVRALQTLLTFELTSASSLGKDTGGLFDKPAQPAPGDGDAAPITWLTLLGRARQPKAAEACALLMTYTALDVTPVFARLRSEMAEETLLAALQCEDGGALSDWMRNPMSTELDWSILEPPTLQAFDTLVTAADGGDMLSELLGGDSTAPHVCALRFAGGTTLLHKASAANRARHVRLLLSAHADCDAQRTSRGDTALHLAVGASAFDAVEALLMDASGQRCLVVKNADGKVPLACSDMSKKSASATAAKKIRQLLAKVAERIAPPKPEALKPAKVQQAAAAPDAKPASPTSPSKAKQLHTSPSTEQRSGLAAASPLATTVRETESLYKRLANESTALTRRSLEEELAKARVHDAAPAALQLGRAVSEGSTRSHTRADVGLNRGKSPSTGSTTAEVPVAPYAAAALATTPTPAAAIGIDAARRAMPPPPAAPSSESVNLFEDHPWRVLIVRPAARDLSSLEVSDKKAALRSLATLAAGIWSGHDVKHLSGPSIPNELSLYESKFGKGARIIWTVGSTLACRAASMPTARVPYS